MTITTTVELDQIRLVTEYLCAIPHGRRRETFDELADQLPGCLFARVKRNHMVSRVFRFRLVFDLSFALSLSKGHHERTTLIVEAPDMVSA